MIPRIKDNRRAAAPVFRRGRDFLVCRWRSAPLSAKLVCGWKCPHPGYARELWLGTYHRMAAPGLAE